MNQKNDLTIIQNFSSDEFSKIIAELVLKEMENLKNSIDNNQHVYLTRLETAQLLHISLTCLNDWSKKGILKPLKLGNRTYFKLSEIEGRLNNSNQR